MGDYWSIIENLIPEDLMSKTNMRDAKTLSKIFDEELTNFLGFETPLDNRKKARNDWSFAISCANRDRQTFYDFLVKKLDKEYKQDSIWKNITSFSKEWLDKESFLFNKLLGFWLEFDLPIEKYPVTPSVFFGPKKTQDFDWIVDYALPLLTGNPVEESHKKNFEKCYLALPQKSHAYQIGTMLGRPSKGIRIVINHLNSEFSKYLQEIGLYKQNQSIEALLTDLESLCDRLVLHFNIGEIIGPDIGIECSFNPSLFHREKRWKELFEYLVEKGMCTQKKKNSLLRFPQLVTEVKNDDFWPKNLKKISKTNMPDNYSSIVTYISHVKVTVHSDGTLTSKAYLGAKHFWLPRD